MRRSWAILASSALSGSFMVVRSWRTQTLRTPKGEMLMPRLSSSFEARAWPQAGCSIASADGGLLDLRRDAVLQDGLPVGEFLERDLAAFVIQFLEAIELSRLYPMILQAWETLPSCLASSSSPALARMIFWSLVMAVSSGVASRHRL